ncbi:PaaD-like zinc ribbon domain-containing protein [Chitinophaga sedimenti]
MLHTPCPHCGGTDTYLRSPFGSTLCRAQHYCKSCGQLFEQFKPVD